MKAIFMHIHKVSQSDVDVLIAYRFQYGDVHRLHGYRFRRIHSDDVEQEPQGPGDANETRN